MAQAIPENAGAGKVTLALTGVEFQLWIALVAFFGAKQTSNHVK